MNARTVNKDMNFSAHNVEGPLEECPYTIMVRDIAFNDLDDVTQSGNGVVRLEVGRTRSLGKTDGCASFC